MNNNFSIGERLREVRTKRGLSQEQVANNADVTPAYFGQVERGIKNITVKTLEKICNALDVSLADFFNFTFIEKNNGIDEISNQILHQLHGKSESEKQAVLRLIKLVFQIQDLK